MNKLQDEDAMSGRYVDKEGIHRNRKLLICYLPNWFRCRGVGSDGVGACNHAGCVQLGDQAHPHHLLEQEALMEGDSDASMISNESQHG